MPHDGKDVTFLKHYHKSDWHVKIPCETTSLGHPNQNKIHIQALQHSDSS